MEIYDLESTSCRKCGNSEHTIAYQNAGQHRDHDGQMQKYDHDFLACKCKRCNYTWHMLTVDSVD